jgi:hypothetical protein
MNLPRAFITMSKPIPSEAASEAVDALELAAANLAAADAVAQHAAAAAEQARMPPPAEVVPTAEAAAAARDAYDAASVEDRAALDEAVEAAIREQKVHKTPEEIAAAKAAALAAAVSLKENLEMLDYMGLPAVYPMFRAMIAASAESNRIKARAVLVVERKLKPRGHGGLEVTIRSSGNADTPAGTPVHKYVVLDECPPDHDTSAELHKLRRHVASTDTWNKSMMINVSNMVHLARVRYQHAAIKQKNLIKRLFPNADQAMFADLKVDKATTTLYLDPAWPTRIGIFVRDPPANPAAPAAAVADAAKN